MSHLYRLRSGFVARFDVAPDRVNHRAVIHASGETHHVISSESDERQLFILQCEHLNRLYDIHTAA